MLEFYYRATKPLTFKCAHKVKVRLCRLVKIFFYFIWPTLTLTLSLWERVRVREDFHPSASAVGGMFVYTEDPARRCQDCQEDALSAEKEQKQDLRLVTQTSRRNALGRQMCKK